MSFGMNRVELIGRLGADVTVNHLTSGGRVANLSIATDESARAGRLGLPGHPGRRRRHGRHGPEPEIAGLRIVLGLEAARGADHTPDAVVAERDAVDAGGGDPGRQFAMVGGVEDLHRERRRCRARIYKVCGKRRRRGQAAATCPSRHPQFSISSKRRSPMRPPSTRKAKR